MVAGANRPDMKLVAPTLYSLVVERPEPTEEEPQGMCLDKGYDSEEVRATLAVFGFTAHSPARGQEARALKRQAGLTARRWVVERAHRGSIVFGACWCAGIRRRTTIWPFFTLPVR